MGEHRDKGIPIQNTQSILENLGKSLEYFIISRKISNFCEQNVQNLFYTYISEWKHLPFSWCIRFYLNAIAPVYFGYLRISTGAAVLTPTILSSLLKHGERGY